MDFIFLLDQSENARRAASDDPQDNYTKFNILEAQMKNIFNNPYLSSTSVKIGVYGYSGYESLEIVSPGSTYATAPNNLSRLRTLSNSGSWTYYGLKNVQSRPNYNNGVVFLVSSQGSSTYARRNLALQEALRVKGQGWRIIVIELVGVNPIDYAELLTIDPSNNTLNDGLSNPKSYRLLSARVNQIINGICSSTTTTSTTKTSSTTTTTRTTPQPPTPPSNSLCSDCMYEGGFSFVADPLYCDTFYQCIPNSDPIKKLCPAGTFWDGDMCNFIDAVKCSKAVCSFASQNATFPSGRCCNKYFECYNNKIYERDCPINQFYNAKTGRCQTSSNKVDVCESSGKFECDRQVYIGEKNLDRCPGYSPDPAGSPCSYIFNGLIMTTPTGTIWDQSKCSIVLDTLRYCDQFPGRAFQDATTKCNANFLSTFNGGSKSVYSERAGSEINIYTIQQEVQLTNDALSFTPTMNDPYFYYYFFNNKDLNVGTAFRVRFNPVNAQIGRTYDILSNNFCSLCKDTIKFTVTLTSPTNHVVSATFVTTEYRSVETTAIINKQSSSNMLEMVVIFGSNSVHGQLTELSNINSPVQTVNFSRTSKSEGVHIARNRCGIQLGRGPNYHFVGLIDEFAEYEGCKNIDEILR
ncbi:hypothetical protein Btru_051481 [Bulinus truncatus]|nr:hypothetical protein Btru_051481 [Bulinus truncatus]